MVDNKATCIQLIATLIADTSNTGAYTWNTAITVPGNRYIVRITPLNGDGEVVYSDSLEFSLIEPSPTILLTSVFSSGEGTVWEKGSTEMVRWSTTQGAGDQGVHIYLLGCNENDLLCTTTTSRLESSYPGRQ